MAVFGDVEPHLAVISKNVAIVYSTVPDKLKMGDWPGTMTAYFVDLTTGGLIRKQEWTTKPRGNPIEEKESEARIFPLSDSRYVVMAGGTLYIYNVSGNQLFQKKLDEGMWSMQPILGGNELVLRHEKAQGKFSSDGISRDVEYSWFNTHTMTVQARLQDRRFDRSQTGMVAFGKLLIYSDPGGLNSLNLENVDRLVCAEEYCKESVLSDVETTSDGLAVASRMGVGVIPLSNTGEK
jgi:hypothetical protein